MRTVSKISFTALFAATLLLNVGGQVLGQQAASGTESDAESAVVPFALPKSGPFNAADIEVKNSAAITDWFRSAHADTAAEAFRHWDEEEEIRAVCATCHSGEGFRDFHGLDGTPAGVVDGPIAPGGVVDCGTCHNAGLAEIKEITFPSGLVHPVQGVEASCMTCHQGRTAGIDIRKVTADMALDEPNPELRFVNPHYATAAATWLGGYGGAGYQYDGRDYSGRFFHARPVSSCNSCHDPHTLEVSMEPCLTCHQADSPEAIRIARQSYDGSGNISVGISRDIQANSTLLLDLIKSYTSDVAGVPVVYDGARYPYFFADANADGLVDEVDGKPVPYGAWTPRSLRTAYNWKLVTSDPGNYAHNPYYTLELLYDAIDDLSGAMGGTIEDLNLLR